VIAPLPAVEVLVNWMGVGLQTCVADTVNVAAGC
jgi:hypothetical protein